MKTGCSVGAWAYAALLVVTACAPLVLVEGAACTVEGATEFCYPGNNKIVGACKAGRKVCRDGLWSPCEGYILPSAEACGDGIDDDCGGDGEAGCGCTESQPCNGDGNDLGVCKTGTQECVNGVLGACLGSVLPQAFDICGDGLDNDCDGSTDEGCDCNLGETQECYGAVEETKGVGACKAGERTCNAGRWPETCSGEVLPEPESCDGIDNDCDGEIDEGVQEVGQMCFDNTQMDGCNRGVYVCLDGKLKCDVFKSKVEVCDGLDNNCNGKIDDNALCPFPQVCSKGMCKNP